MDIFECKEELEKLHKRKMAGEFDDFEGDIDDVDDLLDHGGDFAIISETFDVLYAIDGNFDFDNLTVADHDSIFEVILEMVDWAIYEYIGYVDTETYDSYDGLVGAVSAYNNWVTNRYGGAAIFYNYETDYIWTEVTNSLRLAITLGKRMSLSCELNDRRWLVTMI